MKRKLTIDVKPCLQSRFHDPRASWDVYVDQISYSTCMGTETMDDTLGWASVYVRDRAEHLSVRLMIFGRTDR